MRSRAIVSEAARGTQEATGNISQVRGSLGPYRIGLSEQLLTSANELSQNAGGGGCPGKRKSLTFLQRVRAG